MAENKSTAVEYEDRVSIVMDMLLAGLKRREIIENITKNEDLNLKWAVSVGQIDKYIKSASDEILKPLEKDREKLKAKHYARYDYLYKNLIDAGDFKGAIIANDKMTILTGINEPIKQGIDANITGNMALSIIPEVKVFNLAPPLSNTEDKLDV